MAKTNMIQAASVFSPDTMSSVIPSFPRFSIRGLYLCLFLSCLVIPNNSRKPNVTSYVQAFKFNPPVLVLDRISLFDFVPVKVRIHP